MKKPPRDGTAGRGSGGDGETYAAGASRSVARLRGALRLADLMSMDHQSGELPQGLRDIHRAARQVIGGNLARRAMGPATLERLRGSVVQQSDEAREMRRRLLDLHAGAELLDEAAALIEFFDEALKEIDRQLRSVH